MPAGESEYERITTQLKPFITTFSKLKTRKLSSLMTSLSELISMNPNYSHEKLIADKLITFMFH